MLHRLLNDPRLNRTRILFYEKNMPYYSFTNFSPHPVVYQGKKYPTSEHLFQALKFMKHHGGIAEYIRTHSDLLRVALAVAHKSNKYVRGDWIAVRLQMMDEVLWHKFSQHLDLRDELLGTGNADLVEDSPKDWFWGIGKDGKGRNELGKALERLRSTLKLITSETTQIPQSILSKQTNPDIYFGSKHSPYYGFTSFAPISITYAGNQYLTAEHLFQSLKFHPHRVDIAEYIRNYPVDKPREVKAITQQYRDHVRDDWFLINILLMEDILGYKFAQHHDLILELQNTGRSKLILCNTGDEFWGIGSSGSGSNKFGKMLEKLRNSYEVKLCISKMDILRESGHGSVNVCTCTVRVGR
ncbi:hypothetical protein BDQ17DRAFT_1254835 [Cyathus striatus]|nr:hypothetical protein BDQ17DRAFT_1254835 [Cyathus striatus]